MQTHFYESQGPNVDIVLGSSYCAKWGRKLHQRATPSYNFPIVHAKQCFTESNKLTNYVF